MLNAHCHMYVDGASRGNPGPASLGVTIVDPQSNKIIHEYCEYLGINTNNFAEYSALILGLSKAHQLGFKRINVFTDSQLVVRQYQGAYRVKSVQLRQLLDTVHSVAAKFEQVTVEHIPRSSHFGNVRADALANEALDRQSASQNTNQKF